MPAAVARNTTNTNTTGTSNMTGTIVQNGISTIVPSTSSIVTVSVSEEETRPRRSHHRALLARLPSPGESPWHLNHKLPAPYSLGLAEGQVLIETTYVALNPFDWQGVAFKYGIGEEAKVMGRDGAGRVVGLGKGVDRFKLGDRVWFCANSSASHTGAFQEYSIHSSSEIGHTPDHLSDCQAATLGTGLITAGVALFRTLNLSLDLLSPPSPSPSSVKQKGEWMLIWGGAGITGVYLIALAKILGYRVICSASPTNHEYVKSLGADVVLDRWADSKEIVDDIRKATDDNVRIAIDNVGGETAALCHKILEGSIEWRRINSIKNESSDQVGTGQLVPLAGSPKLSSNSSDSIRSVETLRISFSTTFYNHPLFSEALLDRYDELLASKKLSPARIRLVDGGLEGIENGLEDLRHGRVPGGYKLVARLSDTPDRSISTTNGKRSREEEAEELTPSVEPTTTPPPTTTSAKRAKTETILSSASLPTPAPTPAKRSKESAPGTNTNSDDHLERTLENDSGRSVIAV